jgi:hypothetical protein
VLSSKGSVEVIEQSCVHIELRFVGDEFPKIFYGFRGKCIDCRVEPHPVVDAIRHVLAKYVLTLDRFNWQLLEKSDVLLNDVLLTVMRICRSAVCHVDWLGWYHYVKVTPSGFSITSHLRRSKSTPLHCQLPADARSHPHFNHGECATIGNAWE